MHCASIRYTFPLDTLLANIVIDTWVPYNQAVCGELFFDDKMWPLTNPNEVEIFIVQESGLFHKLRGVCPPFDILRMINRIEQTKAVSVLTHPPPRSIKREKRLFSLIYVSIDTNVMQLLSLHNHPLLKPPKNSSSKSSRRGKSSSSDRRPWRRDWIPSKRECPPCWYTDGFFENPWTLKNRLYPQHIPKYTGRKFNHLARNMDRTN